MTRRTVNVNQACALAGVCRRTIYNWLAADKLEYVRTAGGSVRIYADTLFREGSAVSEDTTVEPPVLRAKALRMAKMELAP